MTPNTGSSPVALKAHSGAGYSAAPVSCPAVGQPWGSWIHSTGQAKWLPAGQELAWASKATQQSKVRWGLSPPLCLLPSTQTTLPRIVAPPYRSPSLWPWSQAMRCLCTPKHPPATVPCHRSQHTVPTPQPHGPTARGFLAPQPAAPSTTALLGAIAAAGEGCGPSAVPVGQHKPPPLGPDVLPRHCPSARRQQPRVPGSHPRRHHVPPTTRPGTARLMDGHGAAARLGRPLTQGSVCP